MPIACGKFDAKIRSTMTELKVIEIFALIVKLKFSLIF